MKIINLENNQTISSISLKDVGDIKVINLAPADSSGGGGGTYQSKTVDSSTANQTIVPDASYDALSSVTVNKYNVESKTVDSSTVSQVITPSAGIDALSSVTVNPYILNNEDVSVYAIDSSISVVPSSGYSGLNTVDVIVPQKLLYVQFDSQAYLDTCIVPTLNTVVKLQFSMPGADTYIFGIQAQNSTDNVYESFWFNRWYYNRGNTGSSTKGGSYINFSHSTELYANCNVEFGNYYVISNGSTTSRSALTSSDWAVADSSMNTLYIGKVHTHDYSNNTESYSGSGDVRISSCKIYDGSTLIRDYVPLAASSVNDPKDHDGNAYTGSSYGLFDKVTNTFAKMSSAGTLTGIYDDASSVYSQLQEKSVNPSTSSTNVASDNSYIGLKKVTVNAVTSSIDSNIQAGNIKEGVAILGVNGSYKPSIDASATGLCLAYSTFTQIPDLIDLTTTTETPENFCASCTNLTSYPFNYLTKVGANSFAYCSALTNIVLSDSITEIDDEAFSNCNGLESISLTSSTPATLGNNVFLNTNNCPIYVLSNLVSTYQTAWSQYASRIQAFPFTTKTYISNENANNAFINLGYVPTLNTSVTIQWAHGGSSGTSGWGCDFGLMGNQWWRFGSYNGADSYICMLGDGLSGMQTTGNLISSDWGVDTVELGNFYVHQTGATQYDWSTKSGYTFTVPFALFGGMKTNGVIEEYASRKLRVYDIVIKESGTEVRHYVPVVDASSNAALFEYHTCQYFYNSGTGTLITD